MMERAEQYRDILRGWKTYCAWGDVPNASGWFLDTDTGMAFLEQVARSSQKLPEIPPVVATHKGFALPGLRPARGDAARHRAGREGRTRTCNFLVYHSGYDIGDTQGPYRATTTSDSDTNTVDALIKSLRENNYDAPRFREQGQGVRQRAQRLRGARLGVAQRDERPRPGRAPARQADQPRRPEADRLGHRQPLVRLAAGRRSSRLRRFEFTERGKELYGLPYGLEGDVEDPTRRRRSPERTIRNGILGRNAARAYGIDPDAQRNAIALRRRQRDCASTAT